MVKFLLLVIVGVTFLIVWSKYDANLIGVRMTMHIYSRDDQTAEETLVTSFFL